MKVKKFLKGFMAAALAVTMMVTPVSSVKAAEVTVTSGASTYTFSQEPVAAFEVTGWRERPIILYVLPEGTTVHSQAGSSEWKALRYSTEVVYLGDYMPYDVDGYEYTEGEDNLRGRTVRSTDDGFPYLMFSAVYHSDVSGIDEISVTFNETKWEDDVFDLTVIPEIFAGIGGSAVQISVADALAMDNANVQLDTANTQTADAQAQAAQQAADAQAAQQAADAQAAAQAQADAQAATQAQQAADAAAQAQITAQPSSTAVSQGTYTVEANDNLSKIAQKVYGDMKAWREIYKANPIIKDDYVIYKGQVLVIPAR